MSLFEQERTAVRRERSSRATRAADTASEKLLSNSTAIRNLARERKYGQLRSLLWTLQDNLSSLQSALSDTEIEEERAQAATLFGLPTIETESGSTVVRPAIIYCDPPWTYANKNHEMGTGAHYNTMSDEEIAALPVAGLAAEDAVLLMWTTLTKLRVAYSIIEAWGFDFRCVFLVWNKISRYYGRPPPSKPAYTKPNAEILLMAMRGSVHSTAGYSANVHTNVLMTRLDDHSHKPDVVRKIIVEMFGDLPRIELFARATVPDWMAWGNEIDGCTVPAPRSNAYVAAPKERQKSQSGNAKKRELVKEHAERRERLAAAASASAAAAPGSNNGKRKMTARAPPSAIQQLEMFEQYNEFAHDEVVFISAPDAELIDHESKRARFLELLEQPAVDGAPRMLLSDYVSRIDLSQTHTLTFTGEPPSSTYPRLTGDQLQQAIELIKEKQVSNSDTLFAFNNKL